MQTCLLLPPPSSASAARGYKHRFDCVADEHYTFISYMYSLLLFTAHDSFMNMIAVRISAHHYTGTQRRLKMTPKIWFRSAHQQIPNVLKVGKRE